MKIKLPSVPSGFADPITGYPPNDEVQMTGLLGYFHQKGSVDWSAVPLLSPDVSLSGRMANEILGQTVICSEYPLFWSSKSELNIWGSMRADLICLSPDQKSVVLIENKLGSIFTGKGADPVAGQLAKQADFLLRCKVPKVCLVLLSTTEWFAKGWYSTELLNTLRLNERNKKVDGFLMRWEDVLASLH
jgi:hypothetical protein